MIPIIKINGRPIGSSVYIVAEMSANHNQRFEQAVEILYAAQHAGADAIKLQTYTPDTLTIQSTAESFQIRSDGLWKDRSLHDLYGEAQTPWEWQPKLKEIADGLGMDLFSSPFDVTAVEFLETMGVPAFKIASFELVDIPLIQRVAKTGKPMIMSTGMASLEEIEEAVNAARDAGCSQIALLKCTSAYPAKPEEMNLQTIPDLARRFGAPVGLSDHTLGIAVPIAAVALGACIVEKHITLSRDAPGPDSAFSLEPDEFKAMVEAVRTVEKALGSVCYGITPKEESSRIFRRSLFIVEDIRAGETFSEGNLRSIRPSCGLHTRYLSSVLGKTATRDIARGTALQWDHVEDSSTVATAEML